MKKYKLLRLRWFKVLVIAFFVLLLGAPNVFAVGTSYTPKENINKNLTASTINGDVGFLNFVGDKITSVWDSLTGTISNVFESLFSINKIAPELSPTSSNPPITSIPPPVVTTPTPPIPTSIEIIPVPQQIIQSGLTGQMGPRGEQGLQGLTGLQGPRGEAGRDGNIVDTSSFVSRTFLDNQVNGIFDSIDNSTQGLSSSLSEEVITKLLTVSGDATIGGNITITGNITGHVAGTINPSFTLGSIPFQGATGLAEDNANLFWDKANSRLGIGTTTPTQKLDVAGSINISSGSTYMYNGVNVITAQTALNNYFFGNSGNLTMTGDHNSATGTNAFKSNTTGTYNVANGSSALRSNTTGNSNTANGAETLYDNTTGSYNTANGLQALSYNIGGINNTANGAEALYSNTTGNYNSANGYQVLFYNTTGNDNSANGADALVYNTTGNDNTANGMNALYSNTTGSKNVALGFSAGKYELGSNAFYVNNIDQVNTAGDKAYSLLYGTFAGTAGTTTGNALTVNGTLTAALINGLLVNQGTNSISGNTALGIGALDAANSGSGQNTAIGYNALTSNITGSANTANGYYSLYSNTYGSNNTANGYQSLYSNTYGSNNTANGYQSLFSNTIAGYNTANGYKSLYSNTTGDGNTAIGYNALFSNTTGVQNTANGMSALTSNTAGNHNTANGYYSLLNNTTGSDNTTNGFSSLNQNTTGVQNTANGFQSLLNNTTGNNNTANGYYSLRSNSTGSNNVAFGYSAGKYELGSNAFYVNNVDESTTANDKAYSLLYGQFSGTAGLLTGQQLTVNGTLNVNGNISATTVNGLLVNQGTNSLSGNTALGVGALDAANSGSGNNTAIGYNALSSNTTGYQNTANGMYSLFSNTSGSNNTANGYTSLYFNTTGGGNTANGFDSLYYNINGYYNTANGQAALRGNTTGSSNTANGWNALRVNTTGSYNTANGVHSLYSNSTGNNNVALGYSAGSYELGSNAFYVDNQDRTNTAGDKAGAILYGVMSATSSSQTLTTNSALTATYGMNIPAGQTYKINGSNVITALPAQADYFFGGAGNLTMTGSSNTANGAYALYHNTTGSYNTANGVSALQTNTTGSYNTANSVSALQNNTTGSSNTATGMNALYANTTGSNNTANGNNALQLNTTGSYNTANGASALNDLNILDGTGNNTALGYNTGRGITTGINNTILGANVTGLAAGLSNNIIIADGAGNQRINVLANGNVGIGTPTPGYALEVNASTNNIAYFHDGATNTGCTLSGGGIIACSSDVRLKKNILDINYGLDTVMALRPVVYNWNYEADGSVKSLGFIAQEVEAIVPKLITTDTSGMKSLNTIGFVPILTKAIQEMNLKVNDLSSLDTTSATSLGSLIKRFLADVGNGIGDFYANRVRTKQICVAKADGTEFCADGDKLEAMAKNSMSSTPTPPTCTSPQILVNNVCTDPAPEILTCILPQTLEITTNTCVTPPLTPPTCTLPQVLDSTTNTCVTPAPEIPTCTPLQTLFNNVCTDPTPTP